MFLSLLLSPLLLLRANAHNTPTTTSSNQSFVTTQGTQFVVDGKPFNFVGTDAYWLPMLNSSDSVRQVLTSIKQTNLTVVRVWGFNDVTEIPPNNATYFQLFQNKTVTINTGPNGLQRLDSVIDIAGELGLRILLTTTNNWNPQNTNNSLVLPNSTALPTNLSHGVLSSDYGGMDLYVRELKGELGTHDDFYNDAEIKTVFKNYLNVLVGRYKDNPTVFGWELANDPRCNSTLKASQFCGTNNVTRWHSEIAQHINQTDPNHLIASGAQGFQCQAGLPQCNKLFSNAPPPPPATSPLPGQQRRKRTASFTERTFWDMITAYRQLRPRKVEKPGSKLIRGRWAAKPARRQTSRALPDSFNGAFGVDSGDILNIPLIGFSSFQLFPDQNFYVSVDPESTNRTQDVIDQGILWIKMQQQIAEEANKPALLTAFGLVSQNSSKSYVPFNSTETLQQQLSNTTDASFNATLGAIANITDAVQAAVYSAWLAAAIEAGISGILQYQWSQVGLNETEGGGVVSPQANDTTSPSAPDTNEPTLTPDDGYAPEQGTGPGTVINSILGNNAALQAARNI